MEKKDLNAKMVRNHVNKSDRAMGGAVIGFTIGAIFYPTNLSVAIILAIAFAIVAYNLRSIQKAIQKYIR